MMDEVKSWVDYQSGYRQAICDLIPDPNVKQNGSNGIFFAYLIGVLIGVLVFKFTRE